MFAAHIIVQPQLPVQSFPSAVQIRSLFGFVIFASLSSNVLSSEPASPSQAFVCTTEQSTEFSFDAKKKVWKPEVFNFGSKWLVQKPIHRPNALHSDTAAYAVYVYGGPTPVLEAVCKNDFNERGYMFCSAEHGEFVMNKMNNRFIKSNTDGYVNRNIDLLPGFFPTTVTVDQ